MRLGVPAWSYIDHGDIGEMSAMKKVLIMGMMLTLFVLAGCARGTAEAATYKNMSVGELNGKMEEGGFFLVDVHIPEQRHIKGTDLFVSYLDVKKNADKFPANKSETIVVYCRSGNMSVDASLDLIDMGYTDVYNIPGGINAWKAAGYPTE